MPSLPGYEVLEMLGRGGMGVVYKARQTTLKRLVAIKMIRDGGHASPEVLARFHVEAEAVARLRHPNIVQIYEIGDHEGQPYVSLEFISGGSLDRFLAGTPRPPREAACLVEVLARAMQAAHSAGIIHRDLKPANILLVSGGVVSGGWSADTTHHSPLTTHLPKITDFGLAKQLDATSARTETGAILGTPSYMAPEQAGGRTSEIGPACDVYALGAILYECLTGRPPFNAATPFDTILQVIADDPMPPARLQRGIPRDLEVICLKCLHKTPAKRYASAAALANDLRAFLDGKPIAARAAGPLERTGKWMRRHPLATTLLSAMLLAVLILVGGALKYSRDMAAEQQKVKAEFEDSRRSLYNLQLALADTLRERDPGRGLALLRDVTRCPDDLRDFTWGLYYRHCQRDRRTFVGACGPVAISPDGKLLVAATLEQIPEMIAKVSVWDADTGQELGVFEQYQAILFPGTLGGVTAVAFSRDGQWLAYGARDGVIKRWRRDPGAARWPLFRELPPLLGHQGHVSSLCFSPDGKLLASAGAWRRDPTEGSMSFSELLLWNVETGKQQDSLGEKQCEFACAVFSPDGKTLAASNAALLPGDAERPPEACPTLRLWTMTPAGPRLQTVLASSTQGHGTLAFSPDGKTLAAAVPDAVQLWNLDSGKATPLPVNGQAAQINFSPDGKSLATADGQAVDLWDVLSGKASAAFRQPGFYPFLPVSVVFAPDGRTMIAGSRLSSGYQPGKVKIIDLRGDFAPRSLAGHTKPIGVLAFSPDGRSLASATGDIRRPPEKGQEIRLWDTVLGKVQGPEVRSDTSPTNLAFSEDGRTLTSASFVRDEQGGRGLVQVLDVTTGQQQELVAHESDTAVRVALSAAGDKVTTVSREGVHLFDVSARKQGPVIRQGAYLAAFSPDGTMLAAAFVENANSLFPTGIVKFWEVATGRELASWTYQPPRSGHPNLARGITSMQFSADGRSLLVDGSSLEMNRLEGNQDTSCVKRWDVAARREVASFRLRGYPLALSPDGRTLAGIPPAQVLYNPTEVKLWDARTGQERATLRGHQSPVRAARFSPDGQTLATGDEGGVIKVWSAAPYLERDAEMAATQGDAGTSAAVR